MNKNQRGFGLTFSLFVFVIVGLIGFSVWFIWQSKNKTNLSNPTAQSQITATNQQTEKAKYLEIKEWGIKVKLAYADLLTYSLKGSSGYNAVFRYLDEAQIEFRTPPADDPNCKETGIYISQVDNPDTFTVKAKVGQFYYGMTVSGGGCEEGALQMKLKTIEELKKPVIEATSS